MTSVEKKSAITVATLGPVTVDVSEGLDYWSRIRRRESTEDGVPWVLGTKIPSNTFFDARGYPHASTIATFRRADEIEFDGLPARFALKATFAHSMLGVFVIETREGQLFDVLKSRQVTLEGIRQEMHELAERFQRSPDEVNFMVEESIEDINGHPVPVDYKFMMFHDQVGMVFSVDRNQTPIRYTYWDGTFQQLPPGAVFHVNTQKMVRGADPAPTWSDQLRELAVSVSSSIPIPMCRVDLYMTPAGPLVGEVTLLPGNFYYENPTAMSAGLSTHLGNLWTEAEQRVSVRFGRYPVCEGDLSLSALLELSGTGAGTEIRRS